MDMSQSVGLPQCGSYLSDEGAGRCGRQRSLFLNELTKIQSLQILHDKEVQVADLVRLKREDNVRM